MTARTPFTEDPAANELLAENPLALMIGMLLDQQFPMERAFYGPYLLQQRIGKIEAGHIAGLDDETLEEAFSGPPAVHRFPKSMGKRTRDLCRVIVDEYGGDAARVWREAEDGKDLVRRLQALPGFGKAKSRTFTAVIGKRLGEGPPGWEQAGADWPSIADVDEFEKVFELREQKRARKAARKAKG